MKAMFAGAQKKTNNMKNWDNYMEKTFFNLTIKYQKSFQAMEQWKGKIKTTATEFSLFLKENPAILKGTVKKQPPQDSTLLTWLAGLYDSWIKLQTNGSLKPDELGASLQGLDDEDVQLEKKIALEYLDNSCEDELWLEDRYNTMRKCYQEKFTFAKFYLRVMHNAAGFQNYKTNTLELIQ